MFASLNQICLSWTKLILSIATLLVAAFDKQGNSENHVNGKDLTVGNAKCVDLPPKESKTPAITTKKKRKSNVEKSLDVVFQKFQDASETDFHRYGD